MKKKLKMTKIVTATSKGQITLPAVWRRQFETNQYTIDIFDDEIILKPIETDAGWTTIFDADRDNGGELLDARDLIKILDSLNR